MEKPSGRILLVEDDPVLGEGLELGLRLEGHCIDWAKTLRNGKEKFESDLYDLAILDIGLPDGHGTDLCKSIREKNREVGIIFLTAKTDEETVVRGLELGANDFVKKPFSLRELRARIQVILRGKWPPIKEIKLGNLLLNPDKREVLYQDQNLSLNRRQFDILKYFMSRPDQIINREQLLNHLDHEGNIFDRTIDSHLSQLRRILKNHGVDKLQIVSIYGIGYRLEVVE